MSISTLSTGTTVIVLDSLVTSNRVTGLSLGLESIGSGNITGGGFTSGTYSVYALAVNVNTGAKLYMFQIKNLTGPANATSSNISLPSNLKPTTGNGATIRRNGYLAFVQLPTNSTTFTVKTGTTAVTNYSFLEIVMAP